MSTANSHESAFVDVSLCYSAASYSTRWDIRHDPQRE